MPDARELQERRETAHLCAERLALTAPLLVDGMDNAADAAYGAWPERLYILDAEGRIFYQGGKGPFGFHVEEAAAAAEALVPRHQG